MKKCTYIIAEIGVNHNGSLALAKKLINMCKKCGADAVKFQTYKTDLIVDQNVEQASYQKKNTTNETQYKMLKKYELSHKEFEILYNYCDKLRIDFLSTAHDIDSLKFLVKSLKVKTIKIASPDITNIQLLLHAAITGKKIIISCGMSSLQDIDVALSAIAYGYVYKNLKYNPKKHYNIFNKHKNVLLKKVKLLHCTSDYPAPLNDLNLDVIENLQNRYNIDIGYSDHSHDLTTPLIAVSKGAKVIETHVTLDNSLSGPDHKISFEYCDFEKYVSNIRKAEIMLGKKNKKVTISERKNVKNVKKYLFFRKNINKNTLITDDYIIAKRCHKGIPSSNYPAVLNTLTKKDFKKDDLIDMKYLRVKHG